MTRIAALYDIHGNLQALEAVLDEIGNARVDRIVVGGDVVPGPMPRESFDRLLSLDIPMDFIRGNGDREVLAQMQGKTTEWFRGAQPAWRDPVAWSASQLNKNHEIQLASWPTTVAIDVPTIGRVLFCHATPRDDNEIFTRLTTEGRLLQSFDKINADLVVCGHTHMQFDRMIGNTRVVNAGSVGMPYGEPLASWLILDSEIEFRQSAYDLIEASQKILSTGFPNSADFMQNILLNPPTEALMLELFGKSDSMTAQE